MVIGVAHEAHSSEQRVALVPAIVPSLTKAGLEVVVEKDAGVKAGFPDSLFEEQGAGIVAQRSEVFQSADLIAQVHALDDSSAEKDFVRPGQILVGLLNPYAVPLTVGRLAEKGVTSFALELLPRISRAQPMDALTSMATVSGYKAILLAAGLHNRMFPMMMTAAGTITPARVLVIGVGVAGLQAIATARRLGASVQAYDVRPVVKEQVESLGAKFVELKLETGEAEAAGGYAKAMGEDFYRRQRELMAKVLAENDIVITTASIPGKKAPILITESMVQAMRSGSVVIDLAAETGGNCELTKPGETLKIGGITLAGPLNVSSTVPYHASMMYARNITSFVLNLVKDGQLMVNLEDQIIKDTLLTHKGEIVNAQMRDLVNPKS
ncbi:MAG: Re/Si-specific NAD(P)(+) transhydrogenase subunit alpha [Ignavibacteriales bacterium]|nr:Re/Si-specific NAD(P)(+) transhydrogenase subunit alpha [Ignavibacteriales bacterium]